MEAHEMFEVTDVSHNSLKSSHKETNKKETSSVQGPHMIKSTQSQMSFPV